MQGNERDGGSTILDIVLSNTEAATLNDENLFMELSSNINHLIQNNFEKLVTLLYRIDVSESKLKYLLKENPNEDAGKMIAHLIIERQIQKIKLKKEMSENERDDEGEERL